MSDESKETRSLSPSLGIPSLNRAKLTEVIPVKVQPGLKKAISKPQSRWIRQIIIEKLNQMRREDQ